MLVNSGNDDDDDELGTRSTHIVSFFSLTYIYAYAVTMMVNDVAQP